MEILAAAISPYEIERGKPMPSLIHSVVQTNLVQRLGNRYEEKYRFLSELSLDLQGWKSVPDVAVYDYFEIDFRQDEIRKTEPPLCAIEILSATQGILELSDKANQYFEYEVRSCWIIIPQFKTIYVFSSAQQYDTFVGTDVLKDMVLGIEIPLGEVFR